MILHVSFFLTLFSRILLQFCVCSQSNWSSQCPPTMNRNLIQFLSESPASIWLTVGIKNIAKRLKKGIAFVRINPMFRLMLPNVIYISNVLSKYFHNLLLWKSNGHRKKKRKRTDQIVSQRRVLSSLKFSVNLKDELPFISYLCLI